MDGAWTWLGRSSFAGFVSVWLFLFAGSQAQAQERSFATLTTGNGHGFQLFDRATGRITSFLEHPYRYVAEATPERTWGIGRRDLAHDAYFGLRVGTHRVWLAHDHAQTEVSYERESHIIHGRSSEGGLTVDTYYFAPFGYEGNALIALVRVHNPKAEAQTASVYFKPNLKLGSGGERREAPDDQGESITFRGTGPLVHAVETGPGGGHAIYAPIGGYDHAGCGADATLYEQLFGSTSVGGAVSCSGPSQVMVFGRDLTIPPGGEAWWGSATLFLDDNPSVAQAASFRDLASVSDVLARFGAYLGTRDAGALHDAALAEHEAFRKNLAPSGLSDDERALWRQSETVLRMAQIREPRAQNRESFGMLLAALPPGEWHIGWLRDSTYAIAALAMTGHHDMAKLGVEFALGADGATRGFFNEGYLNQTYRVSATRYFGNGKEEGDFNADGPNVETDGFGLLSWAARMVLHYSCDSAWLAQTTWRGDTVYEGLREVAEDIATSVVDGLPGADASIWEVHWGRRQVFTYTAAAQVRGLFDFAHIAELAGDTASAQTMRALAETMRQRLLTALVHGPSQSLVSHQGVVSQDVHVDGSTVEALMWNLLETDHPVYAGTLAGFARLVTPFGGYQRLEPALSLTGEQGANPYDASEWIMLDLRIGQAFRRAGDALKADTRLDWVTRAAAANDHLIPELYHPENGSYQGAIPMVGYGAGLWMMTQLEKHGVMPPHYQDDFAHCGDQGNGERDAGVADAGPAAEADGAVGGGTAEPVAEGDGAPTGGAPVQRADSGCALSPGGRDASAGPLLGVSCLLLLVTLNRRRKAAYA
jgi:hypothetical protein